ncbi:MAG: putative bifunctional diguanylate cyclase/phosphodiesterase [Giesbergeria sp.]
MTVVQPTRAQSVVWAVVAFFVSALLLVAAVLIGVTRSSALEEAETQLARYVSGAEAALNRAFLGVDVLLAGTGEALGLDNSAPDWVHPEGASAMLAQISRPNLNIRLLAVLSANGQVLASSDPRGAQLPVHLPDGFVQQALAPAVAVVVLSAPIQSFTSSENVVYLARQLRTLSGEKLLAVAEVPVAMLASVLTQDAQIPGLEVVLETGGGTRMLSVPDAGHAPPPVAPLRKVFADSIDWNMPTRLSGTPGRVVARALIYDDLWISASLSERAALESWYPEVAVVASVSAVFAVLGLVVGYMFSEYLRRMGQARQALAQSKTQLDQALEAMVSGFVLLDSQHRVLHWNHRFNEIFPWIAGIMAPQLPFRKILEATVAHHLPQASEAERCAWIERRLAAQKTSVVPHEQLLPNGRTLQILEHRTPDGGMVITYSDITDMRSAQAEIETLAFYDPLTGLPNRRLLLDRLGQATVQSLRSGRRGALLFLDLDKFKSVNDTLGHEMGDALLRQVAQRLRDGVREADTVARLGGDEFVVMLIDLSGITEEAAAQAQRIAEKLLRSLEQPYELRGYTHQSTASLGATLFGEVPQAAAELLRQADIAMYQIKARHGNGLCFFDPQMQAAISSRAQLEADLKLALRNDEFVLYYQPQFAHDGTMVGAEALLRWQHPERGLVPPGAFIAAAEESDLIVFIGEWVLRTACVQLAQWQSDPRCEKLQLSVNVSARQFRHSGFVQTVLDAVAPLGSRAHLLTLELTESLVLDNVDETVARMHQLRTRGVHFSVDDFGTGYSSLAYLTRLPLHQLKIDQSFVRNLGIRPTDDVIVQTIIGMAQNLELEVIAEGVETEAQRTLLLGYGCAFFQGYLLARPMPVAGLAAVLPRS